MAKRKGNPDQDALFSELDMGKEDHKKLLKLARAFYKARAKRLETLGPLLQEQNEKEQAVIALLKQLKMNGFEHGDMQVKLMPTKEHISAKLATDDDDGESTEGDSKLDAA